VAEDPLWTMNNGAQAKVALEVPKIIIFTVVGGGWPSPHQPSNDRCFATL
jgi:hypothetical protein